MPPIARSRLSAQGRISVPAAIHKRLGIRPGDVLEWAEDGETIVVRRAGKYSFEDIHRALFPKGGPETQKRRAAQDRHQEIRAQGVMGAAVPRGRRESQRRLWRSSQRRSNRALTSSQEIVST